MILYLFYNADLLKIAQRKREIALGFINDVVLAASGKTLEETNRRLRRMMIRQTTTGQKSTTLDLRQASSNFYI